MLIDTHAHLYAQEFDKDREEVLERAENEGVKRIYLPNIDEQTITPLLTLTERYPDLLRPMMGLHPCYVTENYKEQLDMIGNSLDENEFVAIGEAGLDFVSEDGFVEYQKDALHIQAGWAKQRKLPLILHSRGAIDETIQLISDEQNGNLSGIFHCFTGNLTQAMAIIELGFYLGIGGIVTFKNAELDKVLGNIPVEKIVLETDAPYLAPHPYRGKRNESAYLRPIAEKVADIYDLPVADIEEITSNNAQTVFGEKK